MRILQVCSARTLGGGERHVADLADALHERGHEVFVALAPGAPIRDKLARLPPENIISLRMRNAFDVPSALRLARFIRERQIEIVHAHLARDYPLASLAGRRYARLIITRHVLFRLNRLHALTLSRVARVIAVSKAVALSLRAQRLVPEALIEVIHNGIRLERFEGEFSADERERVRARLQLRAGRRLVGAVGSLLPLKGHEEFIRAARRVAEGRDDVDFVIIGDDDESHREHRLELERLIGKLELRERVRLLHWAEDLAPFYRALDVYVSASRSEAFGLSIVEAMAAGVAVVATATEGAQEILADGATGLVVPIGDAERLAKAVTELLSDEDRRQTLAARGREAALARFGLERMVLATERLYLEALKPVGDSVR